MNTLALFSGRPGMMELIVVLFVILLLFGAKKLPGLARSLGKSTSEFKKGKEEGLKEDGEKTEDAPASDA